MVVRDDQRDAGAVPRPAAAAVRAALDADTAEVRAEVGAQWTAWSRLDSVVGALLSETAAWADDTLVIFFSDNGVPFPSGKTNLGYEQGQREPLLVASPLQASRGRRRSRGTGRPRRRPG